MNFWMLDNQLINIHIILKLQSSSIDLMNYILEGPETENCSKRLFSPTVQFPKHPRLRLRHIGRLSERNIVNRILEWVGLRVENECYPKLFRLSKLVNFKKHWKIYSRLNLIKMRWKIEYFRSNSFPVSFWDLRYHFG